MPDENTVTKDRIVLAACPLAAVHGWTQAVLEDACRLAHVDAGRLTDLFPRGPIDAIFHLSDWADREMLRLLGQKKAETLGVRGTIHLAIMTRWRALSPYRDAVKASVPVMMKPWHALCARKMLWTTADTIWTYAGDTSTDYNFYTKRTLLAGVLMVATPVWLRGDDKQTASFLTHRLDNVVAIGKRVGKVVGRLRKNTDEAA